MGRVSGRENIILALTTAFEKLQTILGTIKDAFNEVFEPLTGEELYNVTVRIKEFVSGLAISEEALDNFKMTFKGAFAFVDIIGQGLKAFGQILGHLLEKLLPVGDGFLGMTGSIGEWIVSIDEAIKSGDGLTKFVELVNGAIDKLASGFKVVKDHVVEFIKSFTGIGSVKELLATVSNSISSFFSSIVEHTKSSQGTISAIGDTIKKVAGTIWDTIKTVFK